MKIQNSFIYSLLLFNRISRSYIHLVVILILACYVQETQAQIWIWQELNPIPEAVSNNAVTAAQIDGNTYVYSFTGIDESKQYNGIHAKAWRYSLENDSWEQLPNIPGNKGRIAAGASTINNKIYIVGGYEVFASGNEKSFDELWEFDPNTNEYKALAPLPVPIDDHIQATWRDSLLFIITGWSDRTNVPDVQIYNPQTNEWFKGNSTPDNADYKVFGGSGVIIGDTIYYAGGAKIEGNNFLLGNTFRKGYIHPDDPTMIDWEVSERDLAIGYRMGAITLSDGQAAWIGGSGVAYNYDGIAYNGSGGVPPFRRIVYYQPTNGQLSLNDDFPVAVMDLRSIAAIAPDQFIIAGGMETGQKVSNKTYILTYLADILNGQEAQTIVNPPAVYPSPATDYITIEEEKKGTLTLYHLHGKQALQTSHKKGQSLNLQTLPNGVYLMYFKGKKHTWFKKIIIN